MISIICPTYNCCETVRTFIESVISQESYDYELIIVDGGSTDSTLNILKEYKDQIRYISEPDKGIYDAMNKGISMAKGEWVYFIGADDSLYSNDVIGSVQQYLTDDTDLLLCDIMSPKLGRCSSEYSWKTYMKNTIHHQGCIYRKSIFDKKKYDDTLKIMADYDMNLYVRQNNFVISRCNIIFANHTPEGVSGKPRLQNYREEIDVRNRYLKSGLLRILFSCVSYAKWAKKNL